MLNTTWCSLVCIWLCNCPLVIIYFYIWGRTITFEGLHLLSLHFCHTSFWSFQCYLLFLNSSLLSVFLVSTTLLLKKWILILTILWGWTTIKCPVVRSEYFAYIFKIWVCLEKYYMSLSIFGVWRSKFLLFFFLEPTFGEAEEYQRKFLGNHKSEDVSKR